MKGSHVPQKSLKQRHAISTPDTTQPVNRHPLDSFPQHSLSPGFDVIRFSFRRVSNGSLALVSLFHTCRILYAFSSPLTTVAFDYSSVRGFEACTCRPTSEDLPPSPLQLRTAHDASSRSALVAQRLCENSCLKNLVGTTTALEMNLQYKWSM